VKPAVARTVDTSRLVPLRFFIASLLEKGPFRTTTEG